MFGMSLGELMLIGVVALIVFGPEKLPEIARKLGKFTGELRKTSDGFRREFYNAVYKPSNPTHTLERELKSMLNEPPPQPAELEETKESKND